MATQYLGSEAIRPMEKAMWDLCHRKGYDPHTAFTGLLDYVIHFFDPLGEKIENWRFDDEDNRSFFDIMGIYFDIMKTQIERQRWYDAFGDLYMSLHTKGGGKGQFFTPPHVAKLIAEMSIRNTQYSDTRGTITPMGKRIVINDCAAGSGRLAIAGYVTFLDVMQKGWGWSGTQTMMKRPYVSVVDLDYNCVKMCAVNLAMHGCFGEAVCHDTLTEPNEVRLGYIIGETDYPFPTGLPSIRKEMRPNRFVCTRKVYRYTPDTPRYTPDTPKETKQPQQLNIW